MSTARAGSACCATKCHMYSMPQCDAAAWHGAQLLDSGCPDDGLTPPTYILCHNAVLRRGAVPYLWTAAARAALTLLHLHLSCTCYNISRTVSSISSFSIICSVKPTLTVTNIESVLGRHTAHMSSSVKSKEIYFYTHFL